MPSSSALGATGAIIVPELARETLRVRGPDAKSWLNGVLSCDVASLTPAQGVYGLLLSKQGKIQAELDLVEAGDSVLLGVSPGRGSAVAEQLDRVLVMEDAELSLESALRWFRLHGPGAAEAARAVDVALGRGAIDWLGLGGVALVVRETDVALALRAALAAGAQESPETWSALRIRHGFPSFGSDFDDQDNPHEASLERRAVSWTKGCYLGQEVVCMQDMRGRVKRRLVALELEGSSAVAPESEVLSGAEAAPVGRITSSASEGASSVAMARLKFPYFEGNQPLTVDGRNARIIAPSCSGGGSLQS